MVRHLYINLQQLKKHHSQVRHHPSGFLLSLQCYIFCRKSAVSIQVRTSTLRQIDNYFDSALTSSRPASRVSSGLSGETTKLTSTTNALLASPSQKTLELFRWLFSRSRWSVLRAREGEKPYSQTYYLLA